MGLSPKPCPVVLISHPTPYLYLRSHILIHLSSHFCPAQWFLPRDDLFRGRPEQQQVTFVFMTASCAPAQRTLWKRRTANNEQRDMTFRKREEERGEGRGGGVLDKAMLPIKGIKNLKGPKNRKTEVCFMTGGKGATYTFLSYKWCFERRLTTKATVSLWWETGNIQNTAEPAGCSKVHPSCLLYVSGWEMSHI